MARDDVGFLEALPGLLEGLKQDATATTALEPVTTGQLCCAFDTEKMLATLFEHGTLVTTASDLSRNAVSVAPKQVARRQGGGVYCHIC